MGIKDAKVIEEWLARIASRAFFYALPDGFVPSLVMMDLSAQMVAAFFSASSRTGHDFVQYLMRPVYDFSKAERLDAAAAEKLALRLTQYCTAYEREHTPDECPTFDDIVERNEEQPESFQVKVRDDALFVYTRDNSKHLPEVRSMVHSARYDGGKPYTEDELARSCFHVARNRPLPGYASFDAEDQLPEFRAIRQRAAETPLIRDAYQQFGPWAMLQELLGERPAGDAADRRRVCIDSVLADFPADTYETSELHQLPKHWAKGAQQMEVVHVMSGRHEGSFQSPPVGEADLKFVWFIEHLAPPGAHILIRCADSDMLYILLLHMERIVKRGCVVFLDTRGTSFSKDRYERRFICLNVLAQDLATYSAIYWPGLACPLQVVAFLAVLCGSDYTDNPYYVGTKKIIDTFASTGWKVLKGLIRVANVRDVPENAWIEQECLGAHLDAAQRAALCWPTLVHVEPAVAHTFLRTLYQQRVGAAYFANEFQVPEGTLLAYRELSVYSARFYEKRKDAAKYAVPSEEEAESKLRHTVWTLQYWNNAHLDVGLYPSSLTVVPEMGMPAWGWLRAPESATQGEKRDRTLSAALLRGGQTPLRAIEDVMARFDPAFLRDQAHKEARRKDPKADLSKVVVPASKPPSLVICHSPVVVPYPTLWSLLLAEWIHLVVSNAEAARLAASRADPMLIDT